jgi:hypothetical protein
MDSSDSQIELSILEKLLAPDEPSLALPIARTLRKIKFTQRQQSEVSRLLDKNNAGTITPPERRRLEGYVRVGNFLNLLKLRATSTLASRGNVK